MRETCSCGATFETNDTRYLTSGPDWDTHGRRLITEWRRDHKHSEPVTLTEVHDSGPGLADVTERLTLIAERVALIARMMAVSAK